MYAYMIQVSGSAQDERLFHTKKAALSAFERMPVMDDQWITLKQGAFSIGQHGLVYSHGRVFTLAQRHGSDD